MVDLERYTELPASGVEEIPPQGTMRVPVRLYASPRLPPRLEELAGLARVASLEDVANVVALPDLHIKPQLETPSSTATATRQTVVLGLSSPSPGCGMALALTPLGEADLRPERLDALAAGLAQRLPPDAARRSLRPGNDLASMRSILLGGAPAATGRLGLDPQVAQFMERGGDALQAAGFDAQDGQVLQAVPPALLPLAEREFGSLGRGNHFLELQVVEQVLDTATAEHWGVRPGQVVVMYHADSGRLGALVGRLYAHRLKNNLRGRLIELRIKGDFHLRRSLMSGSPLADLAWRSRYYFTPRRHTLIPAGAPAAQQALRGLAAATNYAFANRLAILAALQAELEAVWGAAGQGARLLYDVTHNSLQQETVEGEALWVHRHNASRALPAGHTGLVGSPFEATGQPLLLPGTNRTYSYLLAAQPGVQSSLYSIDHGAGRSAMRLDGPLDAEQANRYATRMYSLGDGCTGEEPHRSSAGVDEVLGILTRTDLARPVARLRPVALIKDRGY